MQKYCFHCMKPLEASTTCRHCGYNNVNRLPGRPYHLHPGTVLNKRYLLGVALGEGGFGITYIGLDITLGKRVAVKEFFPFGTATRDAQASDVKVIQAEKQTFFQGGVERFLAEAKNVAAFTEDDGIVDVLDYFQENNTAYIVMEYLEGKNLQEAVSENGVFSAERMIALSLPVIKSLSAMHSQGMIHRDISPDNLMLTKSGKLNLMDFGSARYYMSGEHGKEVTLKHGYAPAEQYQRDSRQGPYTDVYALCATIYYCITGIVPMNSPIRVSGDTLRAPSQLGVPITPQQEYALMHGLAPIAQFRTPNMEQLASELTAQPRYYPPVTPVQPAPQPEPPKKKNTALIVTIIIVSLLLVAGGIVTAVLLLGNGDKNNNQSTTAATSATTPVSTAATQPTTVEPTTVAPTAKPTEAPTEVTTAPPEETTSPVVTHTVTFINLDGTVLDTQTVEDGKAATAPPDPVMPDDEYYTYKFDGWGLDFSNVTSDMVVAARFKPVLKQSSTDSTESTQPEQ